MDRNLVVGLFGTCSNSLWRNPFKDAFENNKIPYFDPVRPNWIPEYAAEENNNLEQNGLVVFVITDETVSFGSLAEIGVAIAHRSRNMFQAMVVYIDDQCNDPHVTAEERKRSVNTRALVKSKLREWMIPRVYLVSTIDDALVEAVDQYKDMFRN